MKKSIVFLFFLLTLISCNKKESNKNLQITGNVKGLKTGTLYIQRLTNTTLVTIDTILIDGDSHFKTEIDINSPELLYLSLDRGITNSIDNSLSFFAEKGKINIDTDLEFFYANVKITGSKNQELYDTYKKINSRFNDQQLLLTELKFMAIKNKNQAQLDSILVKENAILKRRYLYAVNFAITNKDHEVAPYVVLSDISDINLKYLDTIKKSITPEVLKSMYGKKFTAFYNERKKEEGK